MATVAKTIVLSGSTPTRINYRAETDVPSQPGNPYPTNTEQTGVTLLLNASGAIWFGSSTMTGDATDSAQFPAGVWTIDLRGDDDLYAIPVAGAVTLGIVLMSV